MMDVMQTNIGRQPSQHLGQNEMRTALNGSIVVTPLWTNTKIGVLLGMDFKGRKHVIMVSMWRGFTSLGCAIPFFLSGHTKIDVNVIMLAVSAAAALVLFSIYCTILNGETSEKEGVDEEDVKAPMLKSGGEKE